MFYAFLLECTLIGGAREGIVTVEEEQKWFRPLAELRDIPEEVIVAAEVAGLDNPRNRQWCRCDTWPFGKVCEVVPCGPFGMQTRYNGVVVGMTGKMSISWHPVGGNLYACDYCVGQDKTTKHMIWARRSYRSQEN